MTKEQAVNAKQGDELHYGACAIVVGPRGGETLKRQCWRVNGACKTWKTRPAEFQLPIKYGLRSYSYLDQQNAQDFHLASECVPTRREA